MKDLFRNKNVRIAVVVAVIVLILLGGFLFLSNRPSTQNQNQDANALPTQIPVPTITADSIGLTLKTGVPGKTVVATIANTAGITAVEYELSYTATGNIPRGAIGQFNLTKNPVSAEITLGTCSDVCHYDQGVSNIKIVLKITKADGKIYQSQATLASAN